MALVWDLIYLGRPSTVFADEFCGYDKPLGNIQYNAAFRKQRKFVHQELGTKVSAGRFAKGQDLEVNRQLARTLNDPENWLQHLKT
ncbi:hypothetical protein IMZ48_38890 [Candidatus Bathyarchaeota archaeon]|nr:hypothetical protein [Candidatus Bathyarchaeota archaeon]